MVSGSGVTSGPTGEHAEKLIEQLMLLNERIAILNERIVGMSIWRNDRGSGPPARTKQPEDYTESEKQRLMREWMRPRA